MADLYREGDHYILDDRTGLKIRASEARKEWTGQLVHRDGWEPRQPQDLVRARPDKMSVDDPRPRPPDVFIGPLVTSIAVRAEAGATQITVESTARMRTGDRLYIVLDNAEIFIATIDIVPDQTDIFLTTGLPWSASPGNQVTDNTAMAEPELP